MTREVGVLMTRHYANGREHSYLIHDADGVPLKFRRYMDARHWLADAQRSIYQLSSQEISRPDYKIVDL